MSINTTQTTRSSESFDTTSSGGPASQPVEQGPEFSHWPLPFPLQIVRDIELAINTGDRLPNIDGSLMAHAERRALLVAIQYASDGRCEPLPRTPNDIWRIYNMLLTKGYEKRNIRILSEGFVSDPLSHPTKKNILDSLEWLVHGAGPGDYRYFHFSGHGQAIESKIGEGKGARVIPESSKNGTSSINDMEIRSLSFDLGQGEKFNTTRRWEKISSQSIASTDLKYYNEAILAYWSSPPWIERLDLMMRGTWDDYNIVRDTEFNSMFARLPEGCVLTTSLDCCHSARMMNSNYKLIGAGFRGGWVGSTANISRMPKDPGSEEDPDVPRVRGMPNFNVISKPEAMYDPNSAPSNWFLPQAFGMQDLTVPAHMITMVEALPGQELMMDKIKADMLSWSACHQRQRAIDHKKGGYFTCAFTKAIADSPQNVKVIELHKLVDKYLRDDLEADMKDQAPLQYCQIWTSVCHGQSAEAVRNRKLDDYFII